MVNSSTVVLYLAFYSYLKKKLAGSSLEPALPFISGSIAAAPTQLIGMPAVNLQSRIFRNPEIKAAQHVSDMLKLNIKTIYSGGFF